MRSIREVLRLGWECGLSNRDIAASCRISATVVRGYLSRATEAGLSWPLPTNLGDAQLEAMLFPAAKLAPEKQHAAPDWAVINTELKRKGMTLQLLWVEYREKHPNGYCYSQFCHLYGEWKKLSEPRMLQTHKAGDKLYVDYSGVTVPLIDPRTGEVTQAQIFVAALGASSYIFAEATASQSLTDWIASHCRCFAHLGGSPRVVVPDNLKSGVTSPCRYEPDINPTYAKLAAHYGIAVVPARVRTPRDKAKVENAVQQVERRVLARLRNHTFHSISEINAAFLPLLELLNSEVMQAFGASRKDLFEKIDRPALRPLPVQPYRPGIWGKARVNVDYHVVVDAHRYSVPFEYIGQSVETHLTDTAVELFSANSRIASHARSHVRNTFTTVREHMPPAHLQTEWREKEFLAKATKHGAQTVRLISAVIESRTVPEHSFRACMGILRLAEKYGSERLNAAASVALASSLLTYKSVSAILKNGVDMEPGLESPQDKPPINHENVRGADYYRQSEEVLNA